MDKHFLYDSIVLQYFNQVYHFVDCTLFNELIQNVVKHSTAERGFYIKLLASEIESWAHVPLSKKAKNLGRDLSSLNIGVLPHTTQSSNVLVLDKYLFTDEALVKELFPSLTSTQLLRILSKFQPSKVSPTPVPKAVLKYVESMGSESDNPLDLKLQIVMLSLPQLQKKEK